MRVGVVGRGYWGDTYCRVLRDLGVEHWQAGRDWKEREKPDRLIVACATPAHYEVAKAAMEMGIPVLIEKPACLTRFEAYDLIASSRIAYVAHTRLYDPAWQAFKASLPEKCLVEAWCGGVTASSPNAELNWWSHLVPMCVDIGADEDAAVFHITEERQPLRFVVNGKYEFRDTSGALENLVSRFLAAEGRDNWGLFLTLFFTFFLEKHVAR